MAWHIAAFQRVKKLPDIRKLMLKSTSKPRQTWRQQMQVMTEWAAKHNALLAAKKQLEITDGR